MKRFVVFLGATLALTGCLPPSLFQTEMPVTASLSDSGGKASLVPHQPLVVRLPANPSTGYSWTYSITGNDVLRLESVNGEAPAPNGMVGVPGDQVWSFRAQGSGRAVLTYVYERAWEKNAPPAKTFTLTVEVAPGQ